MAAQALIETMQGEGRLACPGRTAGVHADPGHAHAPQTAPAARGAGAWPMPLRGSIGNLRRLLHAQSRIESRIVVLQWLVMILVGAGALLPEHIGSGLGAAQSALVLVLLMLHPLAYLGVAACGYRWLDRNPDARVSVFSAIDVAVAVGVLFLTATKPGYTQVLLFSVVLLTATRYSLGRAISITALLALLQCFSILAANTGLQITNVSSAIVAMFAMTYGVNQLSQAERNEAAIAAENARLYQAVLARNRELATLNALTQSAAQDPDPERLLESGLELILSAIPTACGRAYRYNRQDDEVELLFLRNPRGIAERTGEADADAARAAQARSATRGAARVLAGEMVERVSAPVLVQGASAGVLQVFVPAVDSAEEADPEQSITIACRELGTLMERALLREAAQRSMVLEEKNRIARELHDTVLQLLFSSNLHVEWCLHHAEGNDLMTRKLCDIRRLTAQASDEMRSAIFTLSSRIAEVGLVPALEQLSAAFSEQYALPVSFSATGRPPVELPVLTQNALHRVVRESLMNIYKHARASHATVRLVFEGNTITAVVQDDGIGLSEAVVQRYTEESAHFGLRTIARQIEQVGGRFEIRNGDEGGTVVRALVPAGLETGGMILDRSTAN